MMEPSAMRLRNLVVTLGLSIALAACSTSGGALPNVARPQSSNPLFNTMVGVGDSLTAGEQSDGVLGALGVVNPISLFPGNGVPPTQESGFWSLLYQQATGTPAANMYNPATSPLPLIAGPGLLSQLVVTSTGFGPTHSPCDSFNNASYGLGSFGTTRVSTGQQVLDLGIPGITIHEALFMTNPLTGPPPLANCSFPPIPNDPTTQLQPLVMGESQFFYPVLGGFAGRANPLTEVNAAVSLHPTLATVWLGANDLLKFTFSGGLAPSDTPAQMQADLVAIVQRLHSTGAKVVVANLPDVLLLPQFFKGGPTLTATLEAPPFNIPAAAAGAVTAYVQATYGVGPGGYLTEPGFFKVIAALKMGSVTPTLTPPGDFLTDAFAAQVQTLNSAYNQAIKAGAAATNAPLVDVEAAFSAIATAGGVPINPPFCCSLAFGGGLLSIDGLHPSNTGYAIVANLFIQTIDTAYGATIPPLTPAQLLAISQSDPYAPPQGFRRLDFRR